MPADGIESSPSRANMPQHPPGTDNGTPDSSRCELQNLALRREKGGHYPITIPGYTEEPDSPLSENVTMHLRDGESISLKYWSDGSQN